MTDLEHTRYLRELRRGMIRHFDLDELKALTFDLSIDWQELPGEKKSTKSQSLIAYLAKNGRLNELITLLHEERPLVQWPELPLIDQYFEDDDNENFNSDGEIILQQFLDNMSNVILDENTLFNRKTKKTKALVAAVLPRLNRGQKATVIRFLSEAKTAIGMVELDFMDLSGTNLKKVNLARANLRGVNLSNAILIDAIFSGADLSEANLNGATLQRADLSTYVPSPDEKLFAIYSDVKNNTNLVKATLCNADLKDANLGEANLSEANLDGANLSGVMFTNCKLVGASLRKVNLQEVDLFGKNLKGVNLSGADFRGAELIGTNLSETNLCGTNFSGAKMNFRFMFKTKLKKAVYDKNTIWPEGVDPQKYGARFVNS